MTTTHMCLIPTCLRLFNSVGHPQFVHQLSSHYFRGSETPHEIDFRVSWSFSFGYVIRHI